MTHNVMIASRNALLMATAVSSFATFAATAALAAEPKSGLEEILVTAQRRAERQQSVPIAVSTVTAASAKALGVTDMQSVVEQVPGLTYNRISNSIAPFLRGVGQTAATIGNEPSIATFVDDVYTPNGFAGFYEFNNMERVEVLKGPQGTLFGRNATGGVLNVHTKNPTHTPAADVALTVANYGSYGAQFYGTTGLGDKAAVNLAAYGRDQKVGWGRNVVTGDDINKGYAYGARVKILLEPGPDTSLLLTGTSDHQLGGQGISSAVHPGFFGTGGYPNQGFYNSGTNINNYYRSNFTQGSAKLRHDMDALSIVSISAYSKTLAYFAADIDVTPAPIFNASINEYADSFTQEIQLISPEDSPLKWLMGVYYLWDDSHFDATYTGTAFGAAGMALSIASQKTNSISGFGQATAEIAPKTNLTMGIRYTIDKRDFTGRATLGPTLKFGPFPNSQKNSSLTGRIALDYHIAEDVMIYGAFNRGFKSGIFNLSGVAPGAAAGPPPASPETLNAYTAGLKSEWLENRLRVNLEGFYYDYTNIQVQNTVGAASVISNAGAATIKGFEIEMTARPIDNLTVSASVAVTRGKYDSFPGGPAFFPQPPNAQLPLPAAGVCVGIPPYPVAATSVAQRVCNLAGKKTVNTPPVATNLSVSYRLMAAAFPVDIAASWAHGGNYYFEADNSPWVKQGVTDIVNTSLQVSSPNERYSVRVWAKNLTNQEYYSYLAQSTNAGPKYSPAPPRTFGVTLEGHF